MSFLGSLSFRGLRCKSLANAPGLHGFHTRPPSVHGMHGYGLVYLYIYIYHRCAAQGGEAEPSPVGQCIDCAQQQQQRMVHEAHCDGP